MSKFWIIFKTEYSQVVKKKSFIVGIFLTPVFMLAFTYLPMLLASKSASTTEHIAVLDMTEEKVGGQFVKALDKYTLDDGDTPHYFSEAVISLDPKDTSAFTQKLDSLTAALNNEELKYIIVFRPGIEIADSNMFLVTNVESFRSLSHFEREISRIASALRLEQSNVNLGIDSVLAMTRRVDLPKRDAKGESISFEVKWLASMVFVMIIFMTVIGYGQVIMRSVIEEKTSRIMEVLVSSVTPFQLMLGKVMGLGGATLTQLFIWIVLGAGLYFSSGALAFAIDPSVASVIFNPIVIVFFGLFLIFGYILFSTLFALLGSIVNSEKEAQNFVFPITMVLVLPFIVGIALIQEPNSTMAKTLSLIPFFAPTLMMMRIVFIAPSATNVSFFSGILAESTLSLILLVLTTILVIWLSAKIFRVGILMYGKRPTLAEIVKWMRY